VPAHIWATCGRCAGVSEDRGHYLDAGVEGPAPAGVLPGSGGSDEQAM